MAFTSQPFWNATMHRMLGRREEKSVLTAYLPARRVPTRLISIFTWPPPLLGSVLRFLHGMDLPLRGQEHTMLMVERQNCPRHQACLFPSCLPIPPLVQVHHRQLPRPGPRRYLLSPGSRLRTMTWLVTCLLTLTRGQLMAKMMPSRRRAAHRTILTMKVRPHVVHAHDAYRYRRLCLLGLSRGSSEGLLTPRAGLLSFALRLQQPSLLCQ